MLYSPHLQIEALKIPIDTHNRSSLPIKRILFSIVDPATNLKQQKYSLFPIS